MMLQGMAGSCLGVWVAHGEGRFAFRDHETERAIWREKSVALTYADDEGRSTTRYAVLVPGKCI